LRKTQAPENMPEETPETVQSALPEPEGGEGGDQKIDIRN
jgi:hypothetical protein